MKKNWWRQRLDNAGFRMTTPRKIIIDILKNTGQHLSAEDIYILALKINPSVGLTTVYRTLDLFTRIGVAQKFDFGDGKARYELIRNPHKKDHHHHLICVKCNTIIDYSNFMDEELELMQKTEKALTEKYHFKILQHTIHFFGYCRKCQQNA